MVIKLEQIISAPIIRMTHGISGDGSKVSFILDKGDGRFGVEIAEISSLKPLIHLLPSNFMAYGGAWHPIDGSIALNLNGNLWMAHPQDNRFELLQLTKHSQVNPTLLWNKDGNSLFFIKGFNMCFYNNISKQIREVALQDFPGAPNTEVIKLAGDGSKLLVGYRKNPKMILQTSLCVINDQG